MVIFLCLCFFRSLETIRGTDTSDPNCTTCVVFLSMSLSWKGKHTHISSRKSDPWISWGILHKGGEICVRTEVLPDLLAQEPRKISCKLHKHEKIKLQEVREAYDSIVAIRTLMVSVKTIGCTEEAIWP